MKQLREQIRKELKTLMEKEMKYYSAPPEITNALVKDLKLDPLIRYVATLKAANTVPPSYRVFFHNNQFIDLYIEQIGIKAVIKSRSFFIDDVREANEAIALLNREVLTAPVPVSSGDETSTDTGDDAVTEPDEPTEEPEA
jgi:hypothetical protein|tara:strand:- start:479 stop:901 length:423 start_codon:yes stop_codon:yes gene_type:complete